MGAHIVLIYRFPECEVLNPPCLRLDEVSFGYSKDHILFRKVDLSAASDSRICIVSDILERLKN